MSWIEPNPNIKPHVMDWISDNEAIMRKIASGNTSPEEKDRLVKHMMKKIRGCDAE